MSTPYMGVGHKNGDVIRLAALYVVFRKWISDFFFNQAVFCRVEITSGWSESRKKVKQ